MLARLGSPVMLYHYVDNASWLELMRGVVAIPQLEICRTSRVLAAKVEPGGSDELAHHPGGIFKAMP